MPPLRLLSSLAFASTLRTVTPRFEAAHGVRIEATLLPTALLLPRIRAGEHGDAAILTASGMAALVDAGTIDGASVRRLAISSVGVAVRAGAPRPPIGTQQDLVATVLAARSIALSRSGASGQYFEPLMDRLGIGAAIRGKALVIESGYTAELAADGRAELAVQQVSELLMVPGIDVLGPLPPGLGAETPFDGGVFQAATSPGAAAALLAEIASAADVLRTHGLAPA